MDKKELDKIASQMYDHEREMLCELERMFAIMKTQSEKEKNPKKYARGLDELGKKIEILKDKIIFGTGK